MRAATGTFLIIGLLTRAFTAPVDINVDKKGGQRVSTKEILNLEQQLKAQAGEDKKFYPSDVQKSPKFIPPQQKVDGLENKAHEKDILAAPPAGEQPQAPPSEEEPQHEGAPATGPDREPIENPGSEDAAEAEAIPSQFDLAEQDEIEAEKRRDHEKEDAVEKEMMKEREMLGLVGEQGRDYLLGEGFPAREEFEGNERAETEVDEEREEEEALFMQSVMEALRDRPELLQQFLQAGRLDNDVPNDVIVPQSEDEADREAVIRAELLEEAAARGQDWQSDDFVPSQLLEAERMRERNLQAAEEEDEEERELAAQGLPSLEDYQKYHGDSGARVVKKSYNPFGQGRNKSDSAEEESNSSRSASSSVSSSEEFSHSASKENKSSEQESTKEKDSEEEKEEKKRDDEEVLDEQKRVDMSQHLAM